MSTVSRIFLFSIVLLFLTSYCSRHARPTLNPALTQPQKTVALSAGDLRVVFVDNSAYGSTHRAGYNGIAELRHSGQDSSVFVPFYAGFNLEHVFGGDSLKELFEPRRNPMLLYKISDRQVALYQPETPLSHVESLTTFELVQPHYIDVTFQCIIHSKEFFKHNYAGLFWASYIHAPEDKHIYFWGRKKDESTDQWVSAFSKKHGVKSTHLYENDKENIYFAPNFNATLASHFSDYVYSEPFYFGRFHNMALAYLFDRAQGIRFSQSPTGGGAKNPAWDFQFIIPNFKVGKVYSFKARVVYKPFAGAEDIMAEYRNWKNGL